MSQEIHVFCLPCVRGEKRVMRNSAVRSAHASNQGIAIFSGDFLPADGALPWRRQEAPSDSPPEGLIVLRTLTPSSAPQTPPLNLRFRGGKKSAASCATYYAKKGFTCYAFSAPICAGALWGKSELTRAKLKALKNRVKRENEPQSCRGGVFSEITAKIFAFAKRFA